MLHVFVTFVGCVQRKCRASRTLREISGLPSFIPPRPSCDQFAIEVVHGHSRIYNDPLGINPGRAGAEQKGGRCGDLLGPGRGPTTWKCFLRLAPP